MTGVPGIFLQNKTKVGFAIKEELYEEKNRASVSSKPIKMTDAELSKKLGHYQAMSVIWFWVGVPGGSG